MYGLLNIISTLFCIVTLLVDVNSQVLISEIKLWGESSDQFIELYNTRNDTDFPHLSNYSLLLVDDPQINTNQPLTVYHVVDLTAYPTIGASQYLIIQTPNISDIIDSNITFGVVLHLNPDNETEFEVGDNITLSNIDDAVVFNHDATHVMSFLSYMLTKLDNLVQFDIDVNKSLSRCGEIGGHGMFELTAVSKNESNDKACAPLIVTPAPTTTPALTTTLAPDENNTTTPPTVDNNTSTAGSMPSEKDNTTASTAPSTTVYPTTSPAIESTKPPVPTFISPGHNLTINELNIMMGESQHVKFIEIHGPPNAVYLNAKLSLKNGMNDTLLSEHKIPKTDERGLHVIELTKEYNVNCLAIIIYDEDDVVDGFIISKDGSVAESVLEKYTPLIPKQLMVLDPEKMSLTDDVAMSISKCGKMFDEPGNFMLSFASQNHRNNCTTKYHKKIQMKLINGDCKDFKDNIALKKEIADEIVRISGKKCQCGLSSVMFQQPSIYCGSVIYEAYIKTIYKQQLDSYFQIYQEFIKNTKFIFINEKEYTVNTSCYDDCYVHKEPTGNTNNGKDSINVTIAVVVTCVVVFILIVLVVILYLKKKRNGILQFSMIRLEEDNGLLMDDSKGVRFREGSAIII